MGMRYDSRIARVVMVAVSFLAIASAAHAQVIYQQNPGPGSNTASISSTLNNFGQPPGFRVADNFTIAPGGRVDAVNWWGESNSGGNAFTFTFYADGAGVPGAPLLTTLGS